MLNYPERNKTGPYACTQAVPRKVGALAHGIQKRIVRKYFVRKVEIEVASPGRRYPHQGAKGFKRMEQQECKLALKRVENPVCA